MTDHATRLALALGVDSIVTVSAASALPAIDLQ